MARCTMKKVANNAAAAQKTLEWTPRGERREAVQRRAGADLADIMGRLTD